MAMGAYFGPSALDIGAQLEDKEYERWKESAMKEIALMEQRNAAMYTGGIVENEEMAVDANREELEAGLEEVSSAIPAQGVSALGGAVVRP